MSSSMGVDKERTTANAEYYNKSQRRKMKAEAIGISSSLTQKGSANDKHQDFEKIMHFLKSKKGPQKSIFIARACGYETKKQINPTLYEMEKQKIIQKTIRDAKPMWCLFHSTIDMPGNATTSPQQQHFPDNICDSQDIIYHPSGLKNDPAYPKKGGMNSRGYQRSKVNHRGHQKRSNLKSNVDKPNNYSGRIRLNSSGNAFIHSSGISCDGSVTNVTLQTNYPFSHEMLFNKTINDASAPGAYKIQEQLEHSHEKRISTFDFHRKHSPTYPTKRASKQHMIQHDSSKGNTVSSINCGDKYNEHLQCLNIPSPQTYVETNRPEHFEDNSDITVMEDDSEYTDDEEYDLNFRISDVVSIRDTDISSESLALKNCDVKTTVQNYTNSDISCDKNQDDTIFNTIENVEHCVEDDFLGPHSCKMLESETDPKVSKKIIGLKLINQLFDMPFMTTTKEVLASQYNIVPSDLQKVLDTCFKEHWIDYSLFNHVRLTLDGKRYVSEFRQSRKDRSVVQQPYSGPPPYPDQLLQSTATLKPEHDSLWTEKHKSFIEHSHVSNILEDSFGRMHDFPAHKNNADYNKTNQVYLAKRNSRDKLTPLLPLTSQIQFRERDTHSTEFITEPSSSNLTELSSMSQVLHDTFSSFRQHLLQNSKTSISEMEKPSIVDISVQNMRLSSFPNSPMLYQQEYFQQKRRPLLSTPDTRRSINSSQSSSGPGKVALLPCPGQSTHQLPQLLQPLQIHQQEKSTILQISTESFAALNKNPISAFMEYGQCRHTPARIEVLSQRGPSHKPIFTIAAVLGSRIFPGITSSNKKDGKKDAAEQAIRILIAEGQYNMPASSSVMSIPESSMTQFDKIAALTHHKFNQLIAVIPESLVGRKVIAGLVMKMNDADTGTVVALGSGNRCITGDKLSLRGLTVNDCHAEIITRRGFIRFLYYQLKSYDSNKYHPLFEKSTTGKLRIKSSITFHLYISTAPCGDGALFSPRDVESNNAALSDTYNSHKPTFDTNVQGVLRTKMEGGEGTIPVDLEKPVQTWDGIVRGERLRTMSCSDKICRWNVLGLQGALLANFLDPVYLNSITLGFLFDAGHLSRAVCCRLNRGEPSLNRDLPFPFHLNHPVLGRVTACDATRETQKTKSYSINWMLEDEKPEIVDGCQGTCYTGDKNEPSQASRLCKKYLFDCFKQTCRILGHEELHSAQTYSLAKKMSTKFLQTKEMMITKFKDTNCGIWLGKPVEEEMFT